MPSLQRLGDAVGPTAFWMRPRFSLSLCIACLQAATSWAGDEPATVDFERDVVTVLAERCLECHNDSDANGGLRLTTKPHALAGGESGSALVPGDPDASLLIQRVESGEMPPEKHGMRQDLSPRQLTILRAWIAQGAPWPRELDLYERTVKNRGGRDWWSLQPIGDPAVPRVATRQRVVNPIDAFVWAKLESRGMRMAPRADKRTLIRRLYFDLVGLPPSWEEVNAFVHDHSPDAYEKRVDRLLASPHFGERWARYWLDLVRFAETCGYERDQTKPFAWKYRDWVIEAMNTDKAYDRFVVEQLAGDELPDRSEETVVATGFIRVGTWNDEPNDPHEYKYERLEDMVHATSTAFLGLTVKCARCHDHKFDPIYQADYYRIASVFWAGFVEPGPREHLGGPSAQQLGYERIFGWTDRSSNPPPLRLLEQGNPQQPGPIVQPASLSTIPWLERPFTLPPEETRSSTRRLQLARWITDHRNPLTPRVLVNRLWQHHLGQALVRTPNNFGFKGELPTHPQLLDWLALQLVHGGWQMKPLHKLIVMSQTYQQASQHPQQAAYQRVDFANRLWWRAERRRLDAEALRDAMLVASGRLNRHRGGPSYHARASREALEGLSRKSAAWKVSPQKERDRRSVYMFTQRSLTLPLMTAFDFCDTTQPCGKRDVTTVAPQALALLNNQFVHEQSQAMARRVLARAGDQPRRQIAQVWRDAFARDATPEEAAAALEHLSVQRDYFAQRAEAVSTAIADADELALSSLCLVVMNANEFIYVD